MVYEHLLGCFIPKDPSLGFLKLFQVVIARGDILRSVTLMLGVNILLAMGKNTKSFHPIIVGEMFLQLISCFIVLQLWGPFQLTYPPINSKFQPLEVVKPSFLALKPCLTYTLIGS